MVINRFKMKSLLFENSVLIKPEKVLYSVIPHINKFKTVIKIKIPYDLIYFDPYDLYFTVEFDNKTIKPYEGTVKFFQQKNDNQHIYISTNLELNRTYNVNVKFFMN